jgi:glycosyltransferase involved in cell wall biosynthesis
MTTSTTNARPTVVCVVGVRNEAHNLPRFLACAAVWANHIIVADQYSEDATREIAQAHPKVILVRNENREFNEPQRQALLLSEARKIPGPRVIVAMDADEMLPSSFLDSPAWQKMISSPPGTVGQLQLVDLLPLLDRAWNRGHWLNRIYVDDGRPHAAGNMVHSSPPVPLHSGSPRLRFPESLLLHYALADGVRFSRRQIWYQCYEILHSKDFGPVQIFRRYHVFESIPQEETLDADPHWFSLYERSGIDVRHVEPGPTAHYDNDIFNWMTDAGIGPGKFSRLAIWDIDWNQEYQRVRGVKPPIDLSDPRTWSQKMIHRWLSKTQPSFKKFHIRLIDRMIRAMGW